MMRHLLVRTDQKKKKKRRGSGEKGKKTFSIFARDNMASERMNLLFIPTRTHDSRRSFPIHLGNSPLNNTPENTKRVCASSYRLGCTSLPFIERRETRLDLRRRSAVGEEEAKN
jgi:hypothetical protein